MHSVEGSLRLWGIKTAKFQDANLMKHKHARILAFGPQSEEISRENNVHLLLGYATSFKQDTHEPMFLKQAKGGKMRNKREAKWTKYRLVKLKLWR